MSFPIDIFLIESDLLPVEKAKQLFIDGFVSWSASIDKIGIRNAEMIELEAPDYENALVMTNNLFVKISGLMAFLLFLQPVKKLTGFYREREGLEMNILGNFCRVGVF